ncbi:MULTISPECIES: TadE/TadG family type IV pilus assembly protein [Actinomyces]|uniref:Pilus assembly protein n=1 Tax=Actinomyces respiraculi TaxID=2744574 RepID=A0A7T0LJP3_9ACTO|nr:MULTISPECIES: TadE family protein [Actinomyces]QPL05026.1 pilus assembly protein [Actinomyces respiraculi]
MGLRTALTRLRRGQKGQAAVSMAAFVPILVMFLVLLVQGIAAVSAVSELRDAARDGARALEENKAPRPAVMASLPDWIDVTSVTTCGRGCVNVRASIPLGIPSIVEVIRVPISAKATFPTREA